MELSREQTNVANELAETYDSITITQVPVSEARLPNMFWMSGWRDDVLYRHMVSEDGLVVHKEVIPVHPGKRD